MGSFSCKCGAVTEDGQQYNDVAGIFLTISQVSEVESVVGRQGAKISDPEQLEDLVAGEINERIVPVFRCSSCQRVYFGDDDGWASFAPEGRIKL